jgi:hypothetical protein
MCATALVTATAATAYFYHCGLPLLALSVPLLYITAYAMRVVDHLLHVSHVCMYNIALCRS